MENYLLSLKNIYRLLTINDYPVYSTGVISKKRKKGMTLNRFWSQCLLFCWRDTPHGRMIWRTDGSQTRYQSEFINRKKNFPFYEAYLEEMLRAATEEELRRQISVFANVLEEKQYVHSVFLKKIGRFLELARGQDLYMTEEVFRYLTAQVSAAQENAHRAPDSWWAGYLMTVLCLHAAAGNAMSGQRLQMLRVSGELEPERLGGWKALTESEIAAESEPLRFLTLDNSELSRRGLEQERFFGREKELYDLKELFIPGGKYLLRGIGGVGKTELLRQLLAWCVRTKAAQRIAVVQYEENLAVSFAKSFRALTGATVEERFHESLYRLAEQPHQKTVLFLDNLDQSVLEDPFLEELQFLPCTVFATSRRRELEGFLPFEVRGPDADACTLIFRDNYGAVLSKEEKEQLSGLTGQEKWRHPLTLRLLGRAARARKWTLGELTAQMEEQGMRIFWQEKEEPFSLQDIYRRLYSVAGLTDSHYRLARLFAVLPYRSVSRSFARVFFSGFLAPGEEPEETLSRLAQPGWLEETEQGWRMHPVIAECLRAKPSSEEEFEPFWNGVRKYVDPSWIPIMKKDAEVAETFELAFYAACRMNGPVSGRFLLLAADMGLYLLEHFGKNDYVVGNVRRLAASCRESSDEIRVAVANVCLFRVFGIEIPEELPEYEALMEEQERRRTVSRERFCLFALVLGYTEGKAGKYTRSEELLCKGLALAEETPMKLYLLFTLGVVKKDQGRNQEAIEYFERSLQLAADDGRISAADLMDILYNEGICLLRLDRLQEGEQCLRQIERLYQERADEKVAYHAWTFQLKDEIAAKKGDTEAALACAAELLRYIERYHGRRSYSYLAASERLGVACGRTGRYEEALENHLRALGLCRELFPGDRVSLLLILNNTGLTCVDADRLGEAEQYLAEARELSRGMSDALRAEPAWQTARLCRKTGQTDEELRYLREAYEHFLKGYGPEHSRTRMAGERLRELGADEIE